eukprot:114747-Rhodomonas_salina.1
MRRKLGWRKECFGAVNPPKRCGFESFCRSPDETAMLQSRLIHSFQLVMCQLAKPLSPLSPRLTQMFAAQEAAIAHSDNCGQCARDLDVVSG